MPVFTNVVTTWKAAMRAARERVKPLRKHVGRSTTHALVIAMHSCAVSSGHDPTTVAIISSG